VTAEIIFIPVSSGLGKPVLPNLVKVLSDTILNIRQLV
jgi:hypothetical protein